jgi:hypothetical protein
MTAQRTRVSRTWLALREPADAAARARELLEPLERALSDGRRQVIHDLGCGTGAMGRWLGPLLPGPQHWVLHDLDADLLQRAADDVPDPAADGAQVTIETRRSDIAGLPPGELAGATLVTASALLDMLSDAELTQLVTACARAGCPILLTLSVVGQVVLTPPDPLDIRVATAFNSHQRRMTEGGRLLGPEAVASAAGKFGALGAEVIVAPSPWRLGAGQRELIRQWFSGWVGAACDQDPELAVLIDVYCSRRMGQLAAGQLTVSVGHADLLVVPRRAYWSG